MPKWEHTFKIKPKIDYDPAEEGPLTLPNKLVIGPLNMDMEKVYFKEDYCLYGMVDIHFLSRITLLNQKDPIRNEQLIACANDKYNGPELSLAEYPVVTDPDPQHHNYETKFIKGPAREYDPDGTLPPQEPWIPWPWAKPEPNPRAKPNAGTGTKGNKEDFEGASLEGLFEGDESAYVAGLFEGDESPDVAGLFEGDPSTYVAEGPELGLFETPLETFDVASGAELGAFTSTASAPDDLWTAGIISGDGAPSLAGVDDSFGWEAAFVGDESLHFDGGDISLYESAGELGDFNLFTSADDSELLFSSLEGSENLFVKRWRKSPRDFRV
jgi:hypothetical protein